jgi:hypothetical protein
MCILAVPRSSLAHPEELVESFLDPANEKAAPPSDSERFGTPLWEIDAKVPFVGSPVHERMTVESLNRQVGRGRAFNVDYDDAYIRGIFWNDDPDDLLCPQCSALNLRKFDKRWGIAFATRFQNAKKVAASSKDPSVPAFRRGDGLLERSHFGDLQFLHGMAAIDGEEAAQTQRKILSWSEFVYKVATGRIPSKERLDRIPIEDVRQLFAGDSTLGSKTVAELFRGSGAVRRVAIGSLLHIVQDSYAAGHAEREIVVAAPVDGGSPFARGRVIEFHCYTNQDGDIHAADDKWPNDLVLSALVADRNPISIGSRILQFASENGGMGVPWEQVESYLRDVVFAVTDPKHRSGPGDKYRRK